MQNEPTLIFVCLAFVILGAAAVRIVLWLVGKLLKLGLLVGVCAGLLLLAVRALEVLQ